MIFTTFERAWGLIKNEEGRLKQGLGRREGVENAHSSFKTRQG